MYVLILHSRGYYSWSSVGGVCRYAVFDRAPEVQRLDKILCVRFHVRDEEVGWKGGGKTGDYSPASASWSLIFSSIFSRYL